MMNTFRGIMAAFVMSMSVLPVKAEYTAQILETFHYWQVHALYKDGKLAACNMSTGVGPERESGINAYVMFNYNPVLNEIFQMRIIKDEWNMPVGVPTKVIVQIDGKNHNLNAVSDTNQALAIDLNQINIAEFFIAFSKGKQMLIGFEGNERYWNLSLQGSRDAEVLFRYCGEKVSTSPLNREKETPSPLSPNVTSSPIKYY